ncbi:hypothetical protein PUN28_005403 [Cardiocondyla obscurior]|uniref:Uncharacterized protein n=1 Tax=Cardiocondyla obscurior TaxID=286306 RepID=A0AAW2GHC3_9HYME
MNRLSNTNYIPSLENHIYMYVFNATIISHAVIAFELDEPLHYRRIRLAYYMRAADKRRKSPGLVHARPIKATFPARSIEFDGSFTPHRLVDNAESSSASATKDRNSHLSECAPNSIYNHAWRVTQKASEESQNVTHARIKIKSP